MITSPRRALVLLATTCVLFSTLIGSATAATGPSPATGVKVAAGESTAIVSWARARGALSYRVCLRQFLKQTPCALVSARSTSTTVRFAGLRPSNDTDYYAVVYSYRGTARAQSAAQGFNLVLPAPATQVDRRITTTAITATWAPSSGARTYDVCLTTSAIATSCSHRSPRSPARSATFDTLVPTAGTDYYLQVYAYNANGSSHSSRYAVNLPVGAVTSPTVTRTPGTPLVRSEWQPAVNAETYELQFATDAAMTSALPTISTTQPAASTRLSLGAYYYYRVRGINGDATGAWTAATRFRLSSDPTTLSVLTYNLCGQDNCVTPANGMKKWSTRKPIAGRIARSAAADIIATQESHDRDTRFGTELPGFSLAAYYSAKSLYYNSARFESLKSGVITLNAAERKYAVWARLRDRRTRTVFIVADAHLQPHKGRPLDVMREAQTKKLISGIASINPYRYPVIYAGDFNSNKSNANQARYRDGYDAPHQVFTATGIRDASDTAEISTNREWNSSSQAKNPPIKHADHVDHVYADPVITALQFTVMINISGGLYATPFASDHNPVRAVLSIPGR